MKNENRRPLFHCKIKEALSWLWFSSFPHFIVYYKNRVCVCKWVCSWVVCVNVCIIISSHILYYILVLFWYYCMLLCIHKRWKFTVNTRTLYGVSLECFYIEDSMSTFAVVETFTFSACLLCFCHSCLTFYNWKAIDWWLKVLDSVYNALREEKGKSLSTFFSTINGKNFNLLFHLVICY